RIKAFRRGLKDPVAVRLLHDAVDGVVAPRRRPNDAHQQKQEQRAGTGHGEGHLAGAPKLGGPGARAGPREEPVEEAQQHCAAQWKYRRLAGRRLAAAYTAATAAMKNEAHDRLPTKRWPSSGQ